MEHLDIVLLARSEEDVSQEIHISDTVRDKKSSHWKARGLIKKIVGLCVWPMYHSMYISICV